MKEVLGRFTLSFSPLVQVWLEEAFVELGHASESSPEVEEVELLVVLLIDLLSLVGMLFT